MKNFFVSLLFISACNVFCQDYKDKQIHKYSTDNTKIIIDEFLVYNADAKQYMPYEILVENYYDYKKNPLGIRFYNFGCIKTKSSGFWLGQVAKDKFGHAIFKQPIYGIKTLTTLIVNYIEKRNKNTLYKIFNLYAPASDCIGSIKKPDGTCLKGYNKPEIYAKKVGDKIGLGIHDTIKLRDENGNIDIKLMTSIVIGIANFETGKDCKFEESTIQKAILLNE